MNGSFPLCVLCCLLWWGGGTRSDGQTPDFIWQQYTTEHGLPSLEIYQTIQDETGNIWIATDHGLTRYDGYAFKTFSRTDGLEENVIFDPVALPGNRLRFRGLSGKIYDLAVDTIQGWRHNALLEDLVSNLPYAAKGYATDLSTGVVYYALSNLGIVRIDSSGHWQQLAPNRPGFQILRRTAGKPVANSILPIGIAQGSTQADPVQITLIDEPEVNTLTYQFQYGAGDHFYSFQIDDRHWILSSEHEIACFQDTVHLWTSPTTHRVTEILATPNQGIWVAYNHQGGLGWFSDLEALRTGNGSRQLEGISFSALLRDRDGGIWASSLEQGIFYTADQAKTYYHQGMGWPSTIVSSLQPISDTILSIGFLDGQIAELHIDNHTLNLRAGPADEPLQDQYYHSPSGQYFQFFHNKSMVLAPGQERQEILVPSRTGALQSLIAKKIWPAPDDQYGWINSVIGFMALRFEPTQIHWSSDYPERHLPASKRTFSIYEDPDGNIWGSNLDGFFAFDGKDQISYPYRDSLLTNRIDDIVALSDGTLLLATRGQGLIVFRDSLQAVLTMSDGLTTNMLESITLDHEENAWIATLHGLQRVWRDSSGSWKVQRFTVDHGLPSNEIRAVTRMRDEIWCATTRGLVRFPLRQPQDFTLRPRIQWVSVDGNVYPQFDLQEIPADFTVLQIKLSYFDFRRRGRTPFRYRLNPDDQWQGTTEPQLTLLKLKPGDYRLEIQASNPDGYWSPSYPLRFRIAPPWYRAPWFQFGSFTVFALLILFYVLWRNRRLSRQLEIDQRITNLERTALQAQMNPHFLFNVLNTIQSQIAAGEKKSAMDHLAQFARLMRGVLQGSRAQEVSLAQEIAYLKDYLALEKTRFNDQLEFDLYVDSRIQPDDLYLPPMLIQPFVENALIHGLGHRPHDARVVIRFIPVGDDLQIEIEDNGIGLHQSRPVQVNRPSEHQSIGINLTRDRLKILHPKRPTSEALFLEEIRHPDGSIAGTRVRIRVPGVLS